MQLGHNPFKRTLDNHDFMSPDQIAQFLRHHGTGADNRGRQMLAKIVSQYPNARVVDAACGTCVNWEVFKNAGVQCQYTGVDRTEGMLAEARSRYGHEIELRQGYVQELPFEDDSVDVVIMRHILEHLQEGYEAAIVEGLRVAARELVLVFFLDPSPGFVDSIEESDVDENGCSFFWNTYSWPKLTHFIATLGVQMKVERITTPGAAHADTIVRLVK